MQCKVHWPGMDSPFLFLSVSSQSRELCGALPTDSKEKRESISVVQPKLPWKVS